MKSLFLIVAVLALSLTLHAQEPAAPADQAPGMSKLHYLCNGLRPANASFKLEEGVVCFNPSPREVTSTWTFYTADAEPKVLTQKLKPNGRTWGKGYPKGAWGLKIEASEPIAAQVFAEHFPASWNGGFERTTEYERAYNQYSAMSVKALARAFCLPDISSTPSPETMTTIETQWFTVCNPNQAPAKVKFTDYFSDNTSESREITVPAERVSHFEMQEIGLKGYIGGAVTILSDQPIAVLNTRTNEGTSRSKFDQVRLCVFVFMLQ